MRIDLTREELNIVKRVLENQRKMREKRLQIAERDYLKHYSEHVLEKKISERLEQGGE